MRCRCQALRGGLKPAAGGGGGGGGEITLQDVRFAYPSRGTVQVVKGLNIIFRAWKTALPGPANRLSKRRLWTYRYPYESAPEEEKFAMICVKANADGFSSKLPNGYDTMVGERGPLLSGGQKQRIAIARAVVSTLWTRLQAGQRSIAHRLSTIKDADVIYVMGDGLVLESGSHNDGSHNDLLARAGSYAHLVQAQKHRNTNPPTTQADGDLEGDEDFVASARDEIPLGRRNTGRSLASEIIEQRRTLLSKGE
ncbi:hypothetical protein MD484_g9004, partial [Candolleomyces efflorescens]